MRARQTYQQGGIGVIIAIWVGFVVLSIAGYLVWQALTKKDDTTKDTSTSQQETVEEDPESVDEPDGQTTKKEEAGSYRGQRVVSVDGLVSFKVPNGWMIIRTSDNPSRLMTPSIGDRVTQTYAADSAPTIVTGQGEPTSAEFFVTVVPAGQSYTGTASSLILADGTKATRYFDRWVADPNNLDGGSNNYYFYVYVITKNGKTVEVRWTAQTPQGKDLDPKQVTFIDEVVKTLQIK